MRRSLLTLLAVALAACANADTVAPPMSSEAAETSGAPAVPPAAQSYSASADLHALPGSVLGFGLGGTEFVVSTAGSDGVVSLNVPDQPGLVVAVRQADRVVAQADVPRLDADTVRLTLSPVPVVVTFTRR